MNGDRGIRGEKLRKLQYRKEYARFLKNKREEWNEDRNTEQVWEKVMWAMLSSEIEVCGSRLVCESTQRMSGKRCT